MKDIPIIASAVGTKDKQHTFSTLLRERKRAIQYGFYLYAILIDYAMIEDRLLAMIYHMGFIKNYNDNKVYEKSKNDLKLYFKEHNICNNSIKYSINTVSDKCNLIKCVMEWAYCSDNIGKKNKYLSALNSRCKKIPIDEFRNTFSSIMYWKEYRNEIIHALMRKSINSLNTELEERIKDGLSLARALDKYGKRLKRGDYIRNAANL